MFFLYDKNKVFWNIKPSFSLFGITYKVKSLSKSLYTMESKVEVCIRVGLWSSVRVHKQILNPINQLYQKSKPDKLKMNN